MSQEVNYTYGNNNNLTEEDVRRIAREQISGVRKSEVWTNPVTGNCHKVDQGIIPLRTEGVNIPNSLFEDIWRNTPVIANIYTAQEGRSRLAAGTLSKTEEDAVRFNPYTPEFQDAALGLFELKEKVRSGEISPRKAAGIIRNSDYQTLAEQLVSQESYDLTVREYILQEGAATKKTTDTPKIALPVKISAGNPVTGNLNESDTPDPFNPAYTLQEMSLKKAAGRFEISTWFDLTRRIRNVEQDSRAYLDADFPRVFEDAIITQLKGFTDITGAVWDTSTSGVSTNDPTVKINDALTAVSSNGGTVDTAVMNTSAFRALISNSYMKETILSGGTNTAQPVVQPVGRTESHPKLLGIQIFVTRNSNLSTYKSSFWYDKDTLLDVRGPTRVGNYEDVLGTSRGTLMERWYASATVEAGWGREITLAYS